MESITNHNKLVEFAILHNYTFVVMHEKIDFSKRNPYAVIKFVWHYIV